ncbi:MAG: ATP-binding protein [Bacteroidales bacterium]|nr:ATP-binding protein [Bacteroidales bacterium]
MSKHLIIACVALLMAMMAVPMAASTASSTISPSPEASRSRWSRTSAPNTVDDSQTPTDRQIAIGRAMWESGQVKKAETIFMEALNRSQDMSDKVNATNTLAEFYCAVGKLEKAVAAYSSLLASATVEGDTATLISIYSGLGATFSYNGQYVRAMKSYRTAEMMLETQPDTAALADILKGMAITLNAAGDVREALTLIRKARSITPESDLERITEILNVENRIEARMGDYETAYRSISEYSRLRRLLRDRQADDIINSYGNAETEETRFRLAAAEGMRQAISEEQDAERRMALTAAFVMCILLLVLVSTLAIIIRRTTIRREKENNLRQKMQDQERVLHIVSHDSTNQFNTLLGFADVLVQRASKNGGDDEIFAKHIYSSAQTLYQMMSNLLAWSMSQTQMRSKPTVLNVADGLEPVFCSMQIVAADKEIEVRNSIDKRTQAFCDPSHLVIIVRNLINNAIKFTRHGGLVEVTASSYGNKTMIVVTDNGIGMTPEMVERFNCDEMLTSTQGTEREKGNGIGLTICRDLAKTNGGNLIAEPRRKVGTSITLVLPARETTKR